ncbi:MAG TPA: lipase family protein [Candidatus Cybelea sp.]|jgi:pimeloyl-ACP methyl ester carboxylesterase|nr:lipase family protein [Candidatus Cybelea sp.]
MLLAALAYGIAAITPGPPGDAFYRPPQPLPVLEDGALIWARPLRGGAALPSAAVNELVLYETTSSSNAPIAVSGTVAIPPGTPPPQGWPLIAWAHGTVGNAPQCAPSRSSAPNVEQRMLDGFVRLGYAVAQTDYEGNGTPGIHPYFVAAASARDVTGIALAARHVDPQIGRNWVAMGHSEGGAAALATAALGQRLAPRLQLAGAVAYAPLAFAQGVLQHETLSDEPNAGLTIVALMIEGFATVDPRIVPSEMLEPEAAAALPELQKDCLDEVGRDSAWSRFPPRTIFAPQAEGAVEALYGDLLANDPENFSIAVPTLLVQGSADAAIDPRSTLTVAQRLGRGGTPVTVKTYAGATHGSVLAESASDVAAWIARRLAGT